MGGVGLLVVVVYSSYQKLLNETLYCLQHSIYVLSYKITQEEEGNANYSRDR